MKIVYIAHDQQSVDSCMKLNSSATIMLVGPNELPDNIKYVEVIKVRELPNNIEHERKLLTFTASYAIIKNNFFLNDSHICLLEWDCKIPNIDSFNPENDIGAFFYDNGQNFLPDINKDVFLNYLKNKKMNYENLTMGWNTSTNYIIRRSVLAEFVDFYYPSCIDDIQAYDKKKISWYHERIFWVYIYKNRLKIQTFKGAYHEAARSHIRNYINKEYKYIIMSENDLSTSNVLLPTNPGGFGNRFKCWLSCFATGIPTDLSNLAGFNEIIQNTFLNQNKKFKVETWRLCVPRHLVSGLNDNFKKSEFPSGLTTTSTEFKHFHNGDYYIDFLYDIPINLKDFYIKCIQNIPWKPVIQEYINSIEFRPDILAVSVRSWNAKHEQNDQGAKIRARNFNIKKYKDLIYHVMNNNPQFKYVFFSYDNIDLKSEFDEIPNQIKLMDSEIKTSTIDILKNCITLGNCGGIILNRISTYAETAWWLGLCKAEMYPLND